MTVKLNIGAGSTEIEGFQPIDAKLGHDAADLKEYADESVDEIRASHILEHFSFAGVRDALREWVRILKPGGLIRIAVPDVNKLFEGFRDHQNFRFWLMGGQTDGDDFHRSCFDRKLLTAYMREAGLKNIEPWWSSNTDCASLPFSLNLQGTKAASAPEPPYVADRLTGGLSQKPEPDGKIQPPRPGDTTSCSSCRRGEKTETIKITAVMSIPRVGWNDHWGCVLEALRPFRIPVRRFSGVFWGQCMQRALEECVADGIDWVLTLDYDTLFTSQHVDCLLGHLGNNPEIDAVAALQCRRQKDTPLLTRGAEADGQTHRVEIDGSPIKVTTAHFGLTLIRVEAFRDLPKPWFHSQPDEKGEWGDGRIDDDIWFWHLFREHGRSVYVAPDVRVGHLELIAAEFDEDMQPQRTGVFEWLKREKAVA